MKKVVIKFGAYSAITILVLFMLSYFVIGFESTDYGMQEIFGYLSMFLALTFVFFGIKSYRDKHLGGSISFGRALGTGMIIALVPAIVFGAFDTFYVTVINPDFYDNYYAEMYKQLEATYNGDELAAKIEEAESMKAWASPFGTFALMTITVLLLGFIVSLISSVILRKKETTAAA